MITLPAMRGVWNILSVTLSRLVQYAVKAIQPYFMGDRIEYVNGRDYLRTDNGVGITFQLDYGFRVDYEHVFTSSTDNLGDMNLVRLRYDF
ncbi:membrane protein [Salmonella enterica subsp. enterica serovar Typhimurium]|nr:membrane protein [Salmonella enterica subsp. enterica serovar Typhimurium]